ncbi:hypothetical protein [Methanosarcina sp. UBA289]|uniref:hypothetical protein n=1 Tax=Methanosarcina sp. UBA289 TaxID=1915574 RepID=UPI0025DF8932|nr:hypothetical protein [Methanosarcina sp. UBA289]
MLGENSEDPQVSPEDYQKIPEISLGIPILKTRNEVLERQIKNLKENLRKAPDLSELSRLQGRSEELEKRNFYFEGRT